MNIEMKFRDKGAKKFLSLVILFAGVGVLLVSAIPNAYAMSPSISPSPATPVVAGALDVIVTATGASTNHIQGIVRVYEPGVDPAAGGETSFTTCDFGTTVVTVAGRRVFEFRQFSAQGVANEYTMTIGGSDLVIPFTAGAIVPTLGAGISLDENTGIWIRAEGAGSLIPSIDFLTANVGDEYRLATCGYDFAGLPPGRGQYDVTTPFPTQQVVAGEILPIDTTALLIAGITSSPMWILAALGVATGVAVALLKFQVRKQD